MMTLIGCASRGSAIPADSITMADVYEETLQQSAKENIGYYRDEVNANNSAQFQSTPFEESVMQSMNNAFPLLPNPELIMYVYPHFADKEQVPIPGYVTAFLMYEKNYYALPGETTVKSCARTAC